MYDCNVAKRLSVQNVKYTSPEVQNDLIRFVASCVLRDIVAELVEAGWFSLQVDETKELSKTEQLSSLRYLLDQEPVEEFLNVVPTDKLDAKSLSQIIVSTLQWHGIDIQKCVAQSLDGASVMSGCHSGVQRQITDIVPHCLYIHCNAHRLNLVILSCIRNIGKVSSFFDILQRIYVFIIGSTVHKFFSDQLREAKKELNGTEVEMSN